MQPGIKRNIASLGLIQAINFCIPILSLPYITRQLGLDAYGRVVFVNSVLMFAVLFVDFGFSWSGAREIATYREDRSFVSYFFCRSWALQWLLLLGLVVVLFAVYLVAPYIFRGQELLYLIGLGTVVGYILFPTWLFQGLERLDIAAILQVIGKSTALPLLLLCGITKKPEIILMIYYSVSSMLPGILALYWLRSRKVLALKFPSYDSIQQSFKEGLLIFSSRVFISTYTYLVPIGLGWWGGDQSLAIFNVVDRVRLLIQSITSPLTQVLMPRMSYLFKNDPKLVLPLLLKSTVSSLLITLVAATAISSSASLISTFFLGSNPPQAIGLFRLMSFIPVVISLSSILGLQIMLPMGFYRQFAIIMALASMISLFFLKPAVEGKGAIGAAMLLFATELAVTVSMFVFLLNVIKPRIFPSGSIREL